MAYIDELKEHVGHEIGVSDWVVIDQDNIDLHAKNTGDDGWIHTDPKRAAAETPFGCTIAQGFLLVSHLVEMSRRCSCRPKASPTVSTMVSIGYASCNR